MINDVVPPTSSAPKQNQPPEKPLSSADDRSTGFQTPEQVAAHEGPVFTSMSSKAGAPTASSSKQKAGILTWRPTRLQLIIGSVVLVLLLGGVGAWAYASSHKTAVTPAKKAVIVKKPAVIVPLTVPSTLSGLPVSPSVNTGPVTGVMIENSDFARPQSGLLQASVVFEAIAEGGITRFLALYQDTAPTNVGPIRSARPYYEQWALGFDAGYAHVGGSPEALADIKSWGVRDLDQFYNGGSYHRVSSRDAPHNVYTGIPTLNQLEATKGYNSSKFIGFVRKPVAALKQPTANTINLTLSGPDFNVSYAYDATTNSYKRSEGGAPHMDAETNTQLSPKAVVALVMPYSLEPDGYHSDYSTVGSGPVYVFQDGGVTIGQWAKAGNTDQFTFTDANGAVIKLNPGQTWLSAIAKTGNVSYTP